MHRQEKKKSFLTSPSEGFKRFQSTSSRPKVKRETIRNFIEILNNAKVETFSVSQCKTFELL